MCLDGDLVSGSFFVESWISDHAQAECGMEMLTRFDRGGNRVLRISPEGKRIGEVLLPTKYVTCPEFIGTQLLITTRRDPDIQEDCIERGGDVYLVDVGVTGPQKHEFHFDA